MVESTTLVSDRNKYFFHNESVGIVNPDIEMSTTRSAVNQQAIYANNSTAHSRMESYKVNPMFHETKSYGEQTSIGGKSSVSAGQEVSSTKTVAVSLTLEISYAHKNPETTTLMIF